MGPQLARLFAAGEDFALCDGVFVRIDEGHKGDVDVSALGLPERIVYLVWGTLGIVENGGFRHLFEHSVRGDPYFAAALQSFLAIGCYDAADALKKSLVLFPDSKPTSDIRKRISQYEFGVKAIGESFDHQFLDSRDFIVQSLAMYIRARPGAFAHLT